MTTPADKLFHSIKATSRCRFSAAQRLGDKDRSLTRITAFTSAYLIVVTLLPYFMKLPTTVVDTLNFITIVLSLIILVSTLLQYSSGDVVAAEQHHRAGLEMNEILRDLQAKQPSVTVPELEAFNQRFNATLQKYSINHDRVDFQRYQVDNPQEYPYLSAEQILKTKFSLFWQKHFHSFLLAVITVGLLYLVFGYAYPARIIDAPAVSQLSTPVRPHR